MPISEQYLKWLFPIVLIIFLIIRFLFPKFSQNFITEFKKSYIHYFFGAIASLPVYFLSIIFTLFKGQGPLPIGVIIFYILLVAIIYTLPKTIALHYNLQVDKIKMISNICLGININIVINLIVYLVFSII